MHEGVPDGPGGGMVVFGGGGTGGHLYPALALAETLRRRRPDIRIVFFGSSSGIEARVLPSRGFEFRLLPVRGIMGRGTLRKAAALPRLLWSLVRVAGFFLRRRPEAVVVTGGFAGAPAGLVARAFRIPLVLQEQNSVPGLTTRLLSRGASQVHLAFPEARDGLRIESGTLVLDSGNPIRVPERSEEETARRFFRLPLRRPVLLVVGGSQGSRALNTAVLEMVKERVSAGEDLPGGAALLWSTGPLHHDRVRRELEEVGVSGTHDWIRVLGYIDVMPTALSIATVSVSRAGAMATSEFLAWGVPSILVPLPTAAADHQRLNAESLQAHGAARLLPEAELTGPRLLRELGNLLDVPGSVDSLRKAALEMARPEATDRIVDEILPLLSPPRTGGLS